MGTREIQDSPMAEEKLTKVILHEGDKSTFPAMGDEVTVVYEGKLTNGKLFDTTRIRGPFRTQIGVNKVIKGWDDCVPEMSLGERCVLTIPPNLAYGKSGFPPDVIPPDATLIFRMELIGINDKKVEPKPNLYMEPLVPVHLGPPNGSHAPTTTLRKDSLE